MGLSSLYVPLRLSPYQKFPSHSSMRSCFQQAIHGTVKFAYIYRSSHTFARKFWIHIELIYQTFNLIFSWFALANLWLTFSIIIDLLPDLPTVPEFSSAPILIFGTAAVVRSFHHNCISINSYKPICSTDALGESRLEMGLPNIPCLVIRPRLG